MQTRDAAWFVDHFGQAEEMFDHADRMMVDAERALQAANDARRDAQQVASVTEVYQGFPLIVRRDGTHVRMHSPINLLSAVAYQWAGQPEKGWCVRIEDHTNGDGYDGRNKTSAGGDMIGYNGSYNGGWPEDEAIEAAKSWVATGERPTP